MGRGTCPRCGNTDLRTKAEKRVFNGDTHTMRVWHCSQCGWSSV